ncbi:MAG TPA: hypothetical protein VEU47_13475 [Candidatus Cybelea sp.]|nr:hypothetical protein [Candidatus Cybelea sp.]
MGIKDVRDAFLSASADLRCTDCELHTEPDFNNSQRLVIRGFHADGTPFALDSGPFDPRHSPIEKARAMGQEALKKRPGFR